MSRIIRLLSVLQLNDAQLQRLQSVSPCVEIRQQPLSAQQSFSDVLTPDVEILYTHFGNFDLRLTPALRWVQLDSAGVNLLHNTPLWQSDIAITSANGVHAIQIAEHVFSVMLAHSHHLPLSQRLQQSACWAEGPQLEQFVPTELWGTTLGIVGYGAIGRQVARLAHAFGMRVLATKRADRSPAFDGWMLPGTGDADGSIPERYYALDELHTMLAECDVLVLTIPLTAQTYHLIGDAALSALPSHALLVNVGRGSLIDQDALITALQERRIGGAALDVTDPEPLPADSPLWQMDNVILTPHIAGFSQYYNDRAVAMLAENLRRYINGEPLLNLVQRSLGY